jgi:hypothetical protein
MDVFLRCLAHVAVALAGIASTTAILSNLIHGGGNWGAAPGYAVAMGVAATLGVAALRAMWAEQRALNCLHGQLTALAALPEMVHVLRGDALTPRAHRALQAAVHSFLVEAYVAGAAAAPLQEDIETLVTLERTLFGKYDYQARLLDAM